MHSRRIRGFTLVEVLVALVVVALGLTALMVAVKNVARSDIRTAPSTLVEDRVSPGASKDTSKPCTKSISPLVTNSKVMAICS